VDAQGEPVFSVLQNMGLQAGKETGIVVQPSKRTVKLVYVGTDQM
jgi:hypothetical protein